MQKGRRGRRIPLFLFVGVMLCALTQSTWWLIYQVKESTRLRDQVLAVYEERERSLNLELQRIGRPVTEQERRQLLELYPGLALREAEDEPAGLAPVISTQVLERAWKESHSRARMFIAEGSFFTLLVAGIWMQLVAYRRLEDSMRQQSNFISAVTHELKSPLTSISLYAELLEKQDLPDGPRLQAAHSIREETARLTALVEQILRVRTLEAREMRLERVVLDLRELLGRQAEELEHRLQSRRITLRLALEDAPCTVSGDAEALALVAGNLLDNAIKYSPPDSTVTLGLKRHGGLVECWVEDEGQGFEPEESRRLFDRFYRAGDELTRKTTGTGLGLYLVREFVEAMDGRVTAESDGPGCGARFSFSLPLVKGKDA